MKNKNNKEQLIQYLRTKHIDCIQSLWGEIRAYYNKNNIEFGGGYASFGSSVSVVLKDDRFKVSLEDLKEVKEIQGTQYICGFEPYKKVGWFKKILIWLGICEDPNSDNTFSILLDYDGFDRGDRLYNGDGFVFVHSKIKKNK